MKDYIIEVKHLGHKYGDFLVYDDLNFQVEKGKIFGLLGKNGMGKTTTINIMMGFLRPSSGCVKIFGEESHKLSPATRARIGLLHEGHVAYEFFNVEQIEKFYSRFYPKWKREYYYELMDKMGMSYTHKVSKMSCGQRSQVVLGLIMAQLPDLMILDDYSMGLDAGYRRLFIDYLKHYVKERNTTVLITSHIIQDLEKLIDDTIIIGRNKVLLQMDFQQFLKEFHQYDFHHDQGLDIKNDDIITNIESLNNLYSIYSFKEKNEVMDHLRTKEIEVNDMNEIKMSLEDAFIGLTESIEVSMFKSLLEKEWIKLKWVLLAYIIIGYAAIFSIASDLQYAISMHGAVKYWNNVITYHTMYFNILKYLPVLVAIALATIQFIPESINKRYRLAFHLPINEQKLLLFMLLFGVVAMVVLDILLVLGLYVVAYSFFPAEIMSMSLITVIPWFLAGIVCYLGTATLVIEPNWVQKITIGITTYFAFELLLSERLYIQYNTVLPYYLLITLLFGIIILFPGHRLRKGSK